METAVGKLEILFSQAEHELNLLSSKVDAQYSTFITDSEVPNKTCDGAENGKGGVSASHVVQSVQQLRTDLNRVAEDVATLQQQQQQIMLTMQTELATLSSQFASLAAVSQAASEAAQLTSVDGTATAPAH